MEISANCCSSQYQGGTAGKNVSPLYSTDLPWDTQSERANTDAREGSSSVRSSYLEEEPVCEDVHEQLQQHTHRTTAAFDVEEEEPANYPVHDTPCTPCESLDAQMHLHRNPDGSPIVFSCMSCTCRLNQNFVDLVVLAKYLPKGNCIYNMANESLMGVKKGVMTNAAMVTIPLKGKTNEGVQRCAGVTIFCNGQVIVAGVRSYKECVKVMRGLVTRIQQTSSVMKDGMVKYAVEKPNSLDVDMVRGVGISMVSRVFDLCVGLRLERVFHLLVDRYNSTTFNPEIFYAVKVKPSKNINVIVYSTGKIFVTLTGKMDDSNAAVKTLNETYESVAGFIWEHLQDLANLRILGPKRKQKSWGTNLMATVQKKRKTQG